MATTNDVKFQSNWAGRFAQLEALGLNTGRAQQVMNQDWQKVQAGSAPMSGLEATVQLGAAYKDDPAAQRIGFGQTGVSDTPKVKPGLLGGLEAAVGNVAGDVGGLVRNIPKLPIGMVQQFGHDITHIGEVPGDFGKALSQAVSGDFGEALRTIGQVPGMHTWMPLLSEMIPIVGPELAAAELATGPAALLTTGQGRQELEQHPLSEGLLQVVPFGKFLEAGAPAMANLAGIDAEEVAQKAADWQAKKVAGTAMEGDVNPLSPMERVYNAMKSGKTLATGYRGVGALTSKVLPVAMDDWAGARALELAKRFHLDDYSLSVQRGFAQITRKVDLQRNEFLKQAEVFFKDKTPEEVMEFFQKASDPRSFATMTPEEKALFSHAKALERMMRDRGKGEGTLFAAKLDDNNEVIFPGVGRESPIKKLWDNVTKSHQALEKARDEFYRTTQVIERERERLERTVAKEKAMVDYHANTQTREKVIKPSKIAPGVTDPGAWSKMEGSANWWVSASGRSILRAEKGLYVLFDEQQQILGQFRSMAEAKVGAQRLKAPGPGATEFDLVRSGAWQVPENYRGISNERQELGPYSLTKRGKGQWEIRKNGSFQGTFPNEEAAKRFVAGEAAGELREGAGGPQEPRQASQAELARQAHAKAVADAEAAYKAVSAEHGRLQAEMAAQKANFTETDWSQASPRDLPLRALKPGMAIYESTRDRVYAGSKPRTIITRVEKSGYDFASKRSSTDFDVWGYTEGERGEHLVTSGHANKKAAVHVPREMLRDVPQPIQVQGPPEAELRRIAATPRTEAMTTAEDVLNEVRNSGLVAESGPPGYDAIHTTVDGEPAHIFTYRNQQGELVGTLNFAQDATGRVKDIMVGVDPRHQRQGIASELYRRAQAAGFDVEASSGQNLTPEGAAFALGRRARAGSQVDWSQVPVEYKTAKGLKAGDRMVDIRTGQGRVIKSIRSVKGSGKYAVFEDAPDTEVWLGGHASKGHYQSRPEATEAAKGYTTQIVDRPRNPNPTTDPEEMRLRVQEAAMNASLTELRLQDLRKGRVPAENFEGLIHQTPLTEIRVGDRVPGRGDWWRTVISITHDDTGVDPHGNRTGTVTAHFDDGTTWDKFPANMSERVARHLDNTPGTVEVYGDNIRAIRNSDRPMARARINKQDDGTYLVERWTGDDGSWKPVNRAEWQAAMRDAHDRYGHDAYGFAAENPDERGHGIEPDPEPEPPGPRTMTPVPDLPPERRKLMGQAARRFDAAQLRLATAREELRHVEDRPTHQKAALAFQEAKRANELHNQRFLRYFLDNAPAQYHPMLEKEVRDRATIKLKKRESAGELTSEQLDKALDQLHRDLRPDVFPDREWEALVRDVRRGWIGLVGAGYDPLWVHTVSTATFGTAYSTNLFSDRFWTPTQFKAKVFDLTPRIQNVGVAMSSASFEFAREAAVREAIDRYIMPSAVTTQGMRENLEATFQAEKARVAKGGKGTSPFENDGTIFQNLVRENYVQFDPERFGLKRPTSRSGKEEDLWVPKHVNDAFENAARPHKESPVGRLGGKVTGVMKASLFFLSPRHFAHVVLGGAMGMMLTGDWREVTSVVEAWKMMKEGRMPEEMSRGVDVMSTDQIMHMAIGKWAGSRLARINGAVGRIEEMMNNWERCTALLGEEKRGLAKGYSAEHARELAIEHVHKTFVDWDGMTTFERTAIRQWLPFYGFTKYIVRFLLSFPADHPVRAAILAHIAENENKDWNSNLPVTLQKLFFIGSPDKNGNVSVSDIKSINPFRDAANIFSGWGLIGGLNPIAAEVLKGMGLDTLGGTPELYPQLDIDPNSGAIVGKRPGISAASVTEAILPFTGSIDDFFGLTQRARQLKAQNDGAYRQNLFSTLGIPFVPYKINVATEQAKHQKDLYLVAQQAVNEAEKTGDTSQLKAMGEVPWKGHLVPGPSLAALFDWYTANYKQAPAVVMPKTRAV